MGRQRPSLAVARDPLQGRGAHALRRGNPHPRSGMVPVPLQHPKDRKRKSPALPCLAPPMPLWLEVVEADAWHLVARVFPYLPERSHHRSRNLWMRIPRPPLMRLTQKTWSGRLPRPAIKVKNK
ncbi:hypothetical protein ISCGN_003217 [Ixodes scapularis]